MNVYSLVLKLLASVESLNGDEKVTSLLKASSKQYIQNILQSVAGMFVLLVSVIVVVAVLLLTLSASARQDAGQLIRKTVALCYLWHWKRRNGLMFKFDEFSRDMARSGIKSLPEAILRENPRPLATDLNAIDSVTIQGTSNDGQAIVIRIVRHHDRCSEVVVYMRLASGDEYQLPVHPDCLVYNTDGKTFSGGGLTLEVLDPLRKWRISFNGTLMRVNGQPEEDNFVQVQFHFLWKPMSDYVGIPHDYKSNILADQFTKQHSNIIDLLQRLSELLNDGERIEQFGMWHGTVTVGDSQEQTMVLRGFKQRTHGIQNLNLVKNKISIRGVTDHGASFHLFAMTTKNGQSFIYGYICSQCNMFIRHVYQWSVDLNRLATEDQFTMSLKAGNRDYQLEMTSQQKGTSLYSGEEGNFREEIRIFKFKLNGKDGFGFVETGHSTKDIRSLIKKKSLLHLTEPNIKSTDRTVVTFEEVECRSSKIVGGKGSSLALMTALGQTGWQLPIQFEVPQGVCVTNLAFERHVRDHPEVETEIKTLEKIAWKRIAGSIEQQCKRLVPLVQNTVVSHAIKMQLKSALVKTFGDQFENYKFAVRSSAIGEDGEELSAAGQNETFLGIKGLEEISSAIVKCWASQFSHRSIEYKRQNGQLLNGGMAVVVQQMVPADVAGVLFTNHPVTGSRAYMLISSNYGLGESVVSGSADPDTILLKRNWDDKLSVLSKQVGEKKVKITMTDTNGISSSEVSSELSNQITVTDEMAIKLGQIAIYLEQSCGSARDIEWAIKEDKIYLLQSRPVTTENALTDIEIQHEFDTVLRTDNEVFTTANVGEVFPGASTPLTLSTLTRRFTLGFAKISLWKTNCHRFDPLVQEANGVSYNRLLFSRMHEKLINLSPKKSAVAKALEIAIFGEIQDDAHLIQQAFERADGPPLLATKKTLVMVLQGVVFGKWIAESVNRKFRQYPPLARNANTISEAYKDLEDHFADVDEMLLAHVRTTMSSGLYNLIVMNCLASGRDYTTDQYTDFAQLTSGAIGTESGDVPHSLKELAASIGDDIEPTQFSNMSTENALKWITEGTLPSSSKYHQFTARHGHRGYKEFDFSSKTWSTEPERLVKILQEMLRNPTPRRANVENVTKPDLIDNLLTPLSPIKKTILRLVNSRARIGVGRRELVKSLFIKVVDGFRKGYWHLAEMMVTEGMLPDKELMFFLTHEEIGIVIETRSAKLIRRAKQRQRMHPILDNYKFPLIMNGIPVPVNFIQEEVALDGLTQVTGFPVSQGVIQGLAKVIHSFQEVHTIKQGDILITAFTDIGWSPYFPMLAGIVTEIGGLVSHGAVVAREFGLPCIVGAQNATRIFKSGDVVLLNANKGILAKVAPNE